MELTLLHVSDCPNRQLLDERVRTALAQRGLTGIPVRRHEVTTDEQAQALRFVGSPALLIDGQDPFAEPDAAVGLTCRVYRTAHGLAGAPTVQQIVQALAAAEG